MNNENEDGCNPLGNELPEDAVHATKAAQVLRCNVRQIHRLVMAGELPGWRVKTGRSKPRLFVSMADVRARISRVQPASGQAPPVPELAKVQRRRRTARLLKEFGLKVPDSRGGRPDA